MNKNATVVICDDHSLFREGIKSILREEPLIEVVGEAATGAQAVKTALELHPSVVLMDIEMPDLSGFDATRRIKQAEESIKVLILTMYPLEDLVGRCKEAGASGYILKDKMNSLLIEAIHTLGRGKSFFIPTKPA